jgi:hypothetical protein
MVAGSPFMTIRKGVVLHDTMRINLRREPGREETGEEGNRNGTRRGWRENLSGRQRFSTLPKRERNGERIEEEERNLSGSPPPRVDRYWEPFADV